MRRKSGVSAIDWYQGVVVASDEAGYGAWAGPLVVCAVSAPAGWDDPRFTDSKQLSPKEREVLYEDIKANHRAMGLSYRLRIVDALETDRCGVYRSLVSSHGYLHREVGALLDTPYISIVDGTLPLDKMGLSAKAAFSLPKADALIPECGVASIIAKVEHDRIMRRLAKEWPEYHFDTNMGYGGGESCPHRKALREFGPCPEHRRAYQPVAEVLAQRERDAQPSMNDLIALLED